MSENHNTRNPGEPLGREPLAGEAEMRVRQQVEDALSLAEYAVESGLKSADGQPLAFDDIAVIHKTAAALGILSMSSGANQGAATSPGSLTADQWIVFEQAYYRLALATAPVTAETLKNTKEISRRERPLSGMLRAGTSSLMARIGDFVLGYSPAQRFTRRFWLVAIGFALFVIIAEWQINLLGLRTDAVAIKPTKDLLELLIPWCYGGLGACAYLLRSAHRYIYRRTFDMRRTPEFLNRVLLGSISGGTVTLFSSYLAGQDDTVAHFGPAALGFIAGYSTDFLFNTIERIVVAIFPKVDIEPVPRDSSAAGGNKTNP